LAKEAKSTSSSGNGNSYDNTLLISTYAPYQILLFDTFKASKGLIDIFAIPASMISFEMI
jgi:hypothetical protein